MILFLVRIPLTLVLVYWFTKALTRFSELTGGDIIMLLAYGLFGGIFLAIVWAPVIGEKLSDPLTSTITRETSLPPQTNSLVQAIGYLQARGWHRLALPLVFIEGIRHPKLPQAALLGLRSARRGSFLEKCFAKEVYHFNNIQNCLYAYKILQERHGITLPPHQQPEVNLALMNLNRKPAPEPAKLQLKPPAKPPRSERNPRIKLFEE